MADATFRFGVSTDDKEIATLEKKVDDLVAKMERKHTVGADSSAAEAALAKIDSAAEDTGRKLESIGDTMKKAFTFDALSGAGAFLSGIEEKGTEAAAALRTMQAQTGLAGAELDAMKARAVDAFRNGVGGSVAEATKAIATAQQQLGQFLDPAGMDAFLSRAAGIGKTFDKDIGEVVSKSRTFIAQFGLEGQEAGDLISFAMQKAGTSMDDVLDTTDEYSQLVKEAGFSAQEFVGILTTGVQAGVRDTDKLADALKETQIRLKAGDITTALGDISSPITKTIAGIVKAGEQGKKSVKEVMLESAQAIETAFDEGKISESVRSKLQTAISGTPAEDIGSEMYGRIFSAPIDTDAITAQATEAGAAMAATIGTQNIFQGVLKDAQAFGESAAASLAPFIGGAGSAVSAVGQLGPALTLAKDNMGALKGAASSVGSGLVSFLTNPATIAIAALVGLGFALDALTDTHLEELEAELAAGQARLKAVDIQKQQLSVTIKQTEATPALAKEYEKLASKTSLTGVEQKKLTDVSLQLNRTYPGLIKSGGDYAASLDAVKKQAEQTKGRVADMQRQMEELNKQSQRIAEANRQIQAEILQEQIVTKLFTAQSGAFGKLDVFFNSLIGETSSGVDTLNAKMGDFFKQLLSSQTEADVVRRVGNLQLKLLSLVQAGNVSKESSQELEGLLTQLSTVLTARFKKIEADGAAAGRRTGTDFGTGVATEAERAMLTGISGLDSLLATEFEDKLREALYGPTGVIARGATELEIVRAKFSQEEERLVEKFRLQQKAIEDQLFETDATGRRVEKKLTKAAADQLRQALSLITGDRRKELDQLGKDLEAALRDYERRFKGGIPLRVGVVTEIAPLRLEPLAVDPLERAVNERISTLVAGYGTMLQNVTTSLAQALDNTDADRLRSEIETLRREESALDLSLARRGEMSEEEARHRAAIGEERARKEQELADRTVDIWTAAQGVLAGVFTSIRDSYSKAFTDGIAKVSDGSAELKDVIDDALIYINAATLSALAANEDAGKAFLRSAFDVLQAMVPIWSAQILGGALATPASILTAGGAGVTEWIALTALIQGAVAGVRAGLGFWEGVVGFDPRGFDPRDHPHGKVGIPGDLSRRDSMWAMVAAGESYMTREATASNAPLLEAINRWPSIDFADALTRIRHDEVRALVFEEARRWHREDADARHAHVAVMVAHEAIRRTDELAERIDRGQRQMSGQMAAMAGAIERGIPVRARSRTRRGAIEEVWETDARRTLARS